MKLLLVDGHYYAYRSFFAIRGLTNSKGEPTNAVYGFIKTLRRMVTDLEPELAAVCWDQGLPERRTQLQPEYKQQRAEMPDDLSVQLPLIRDMVAAAGFREIAEPDTEADDWMAVYALEAQKQGMEAVLATNDKDLFQLVGDGIYIYTTAKADLASPKDKFALLGRPEAEAKWGVAPDRIGDVLALTGDSVDNIRGVEGLGPKTAVKLIREFGSLEDLLARAPEIGSPKIREKIVEAHDRILANREMVRLDLDLQPPVPLRELRIEPRYEDWLKLIEACEFKSLLKEVQAEAERKKTPQQGELF